MKILKNFQKLNEYSNTLAHMGGGYSQVDLICILTSSVH